MVPNAPRDEDRRYHAAGETVSARRISGRTRRSHGVRAAWSSGGTGQTYAPQVFLGTDCEESFAAYTVTVTDTVTGQRATSQPAYHGYDYGTPGEECD